MRFNTPYVSQRYMAWAKAEAAKRLKAEEYIKEGRIRAEDESVWRMHRWNEGSGKYWDEQRHGQQVRDWVQHYVEEGRKKIARRAEETQTAADFKPQIDSFFQRKPGAQQVSTFGNPRRQIPISLGDPDGDPIRPERDDEPPPPPPKPKIPIQL